MEYISGVMENISAVLFTIWNLEEERMTEPERLVLSRTLVYFAITKL